MGALVLEATNRKPEVLVMVVQVRIVAAVVQVHEGRVAAIVLCRTPKGRVVALVDVTPVVAPVAGRERGEGEGIRAIATIIPSGCGLEHLACGWLTADCREQSFEFRFYWQMPALWANTANRISRRAGCAITTALAVRAPCAHAVHSRRPCVKAAVLGAVACTVIVTVTVLRFIVQILRHPGLRTYFYVFIDLIVACIAKLFCRIIRFHAAHGLVYRNRRIPASNGHGSVPVVCQATARSIFAIVTIVPFRALFSLVTFLPLLTLFTLVALFPLRTVLAVGTILAVLAVLTVKRGPFPVDAGIRRGRIQRIHKSALVFRGALGHVLALFDNLHARFVHLSDFGDLIAAGDKQQNGNCRNNKRKSKPHFSHNHFSTKKMFLDNLYNFSASTSGTADNVPWCMLA